MKKYHRLAPGPTKIAPVFSGRSAGRSSIRAPEFERIRSVLGELLETRSDGAAQPPMPFTAEVVQRPATCAKRQRVMSPNPKWNGHVSIEP